MHLWGWQFKGKDAGYPAVDVVDERIGGYEGMMRLMERGRAHNATVALSDNYDYAYKSSPAWDDTMIARRLDGGLWQSRSWTGEVSWILGLAKYMEGAGWSVYVLHDDRVMDASASTAGGGIRA